MGCSDEKGKGGRKALKNRPREGMTSRHSRAAEAVLGRDTLVGGTVLLETVVLTCQPSSIGLGMCVTWELGHVGE